MKFDSKSGQSTLEFLLIMILGFIVVGAVVGRPGGENGIPATLQRASPRLGKQVELNLETGGGFAKETAKWGEPPKQ